MNKQVSLVLVERTGVLRSSVLKPADWAAATKADPATAEPLAKADPATAEPLAKGTSDLIVGALHKRCGFKKPDGFALQTTWDVVAADDTPYRIRLYGKNNAARSKTTSENPYIFPPPIANQQLVGSCALVATDASGDLVSLSVSLWNQLRARLLGETDAPVDAARTPKKTKSADTGMSKGKRITDAPSGQLKGGETTSVAAKKKTEEEYEKEDEDTELTEEAYV